MSRIFTDDDLLTWEAYASGGDFGLPTGPRIVFNCVSKPGSRGRYVDAEGDEADAAALVSELPQARLLEMLRASRPLD